MPSSATDPELLRLLRRVRNLQRRSEREREGCYWIEGCRSLVQATGSQHEIVALVICPKLLHSSVPEMIARRLKRTGIPRWIVTPEQFRSVSLLPRASGVGAIVRQRWTPLDAVDPRQGLAWLIVETLRNPGNFGTILRTAEAVGIGGVICLGSAGDPYDPGVVRASMGGLFPLTLVRTDHRPFADWSCRHGLHVLGLSPEAESVWSVNLPDGPLGILIGEEREGVTAAGRALCDGLVSLPMCGRADSLNVSIAAGVMLYDLVRRGRGAAGVAGNGSGGPPA